jgi:serine/threonine protein kinase
MLLERGLITADQLREALIERARKVAEGDKSATPLGGILVRKGFLTDSQLVGLVVETGKGETTVRREISEGAPAPELPPMPGTVGPREGAQLGKYRLVRELGRGGMGVVFEAIDTQLQRKVALKLMLTNPNSDPKQRAVEEERFIQEAQLSARLKHPNIVTVYEAGLLEGRQFLAMEMIEGEGFNDWRKSASIRDQVRVLRDVCQAVHHAHEQGILHRDLKPRNILMGPSNRPYVTDFGLAKSLAKGANAQNSLTGSGAVVGTPAYMSPEQAQGLQRVDWRTDIYSMGIILYECMTGKTPFTGESPIEILMKVVKDAPKPPLQAVTHAQAIGLDKGIENICLKAIAKRDKDRYVTAQAFADDLTKWLAGEEIKIVLPKAKKATSAKRMGVLVGTLVLALLALSGFLAWSFLAKPSVAADLETARRLMDEGDFQGALQNYWIVLAKDPDNKEGREGQIRAKEGIAAKAKAFEDELRKKLEQGLKDAERLQQEAEEKRRLEALAVNDEERRVAAEAVRKAEAAARKAEAEAAAAAKNLERLRPFLKDAAGGGDIWKGAVSLLTFTDPARHAVWGTWEFKEGLVSDRGPRSRIEIPYQLPPEYDLRVLLERRTGSGGISLILPRGGQQFRLEIGGESNTRSCIEVFKDFKDVHRVAEASSSLVLPNDVPTMVVVQVRRDAVNVKLAGQTILEWKGESKDYSLSPEWRLRNSLRMGLGSSESQAVFHLLELAEISEKGRPGGAVAQPALRALTVLPGLLKPGLVAEYFHGTSFDVLALRRIEHLMDLQWLEASPWSGGPVDRFSARFTGYLHVPRTAQYTFSGAADDGFRLLIDDVQVMAGATTRSDSALTAEVTLEAGYHRIAIEYFEISFRAGLSIAWTPGTGVSPVPLGQKSILHAELDYRPFQAQVLPQAKGILGVHANNVTGAAFIPGGKGLVTSGEDRRMRYWDLETRKESGAASMHPSGVLCVAFSPDGRMIASGARDQRVRIWDAANRTEIRPLEGFREYVQCASFSPDGRWIAAGSYDRTVRIWDASTGELKHALSGHEGGVESLAFTPDGSRIVTGSLDRTVRVWEVESGKELKVLRGHADFVASVVVSQDGRTVYSGGWDAQVKAWDLQDGKELRRWRNGTEEVTCIALSPDGRLLVVGGNDGIIRIWDLIEGKDPLTLPGHTARVGALAFGPASRRLVSGGSDSTVRVWLLE